MSQGHVVATNTTGLVMAKDAMLAFDCVWVASKDVVLSVCPHPKLVRQ
jgi:hypothetical protein